jgi:hypothetical protein
MTANAATGRPPTDLWRRALTDPSLRDLPYCQDPIFWSSRYEST